MIILSTPFEDLRKELLAMPKGFSVGEVLSRGKEYEALQASQASLKSMSEATAATNIDAVKTTAPCGNCGLQPQAQLLPSI